MFGNFKLNDVVFIFIFFVLFPFLVLILTNNCLYLAMGKQRKLKQQAQAFDMERNNTRIPTLRGRGHTKKRKRLTEETESQLLNVFNETMELRLINMINSCVEKRKNLQDLKKEQLAIKRLPKGLVTDVEDAAGCPPTTLEKLLKRKKKRSLIFWFDFIEASFEAVCNKVTNPQIETLRVESSQTVVSESSSKPDEIFRTCTTSMNTILRADITGNVKNIFFNKINKAIEESSDYTLKLSIVLFAKMLSFKSHSFIINDSDNIKIQPSAGAQLSSFFPSNFQNAGAVKKP
ncbi:MAG: hypothetical protein EXX96DRAFT_304290, partial [Benjaminiella poitrasii]